MGAGAAGFERRFLASRTVRCGLILVAWETPKQK